MTTSDGRISIGRISIENELAVLTFERRLPHPIERVWAALTDPAERGQWIVEPGVVRYELRPDGDGTLLRFSHRGLGVRNANGFRPGTHAYLDRLEAHLSGAEIPDWRERYREVADSTYGGQTW